MGGGAAFDHAQAGGAGLDQRAEVGGGELVGDDDGAGRHLQLRGVAEEHAQRAFLQVAQVVGAFGEKRVAQCLENLALRLDRPVPGMGGADPLVDQHVGGIQQPRVLQQRQMGGEDRRFVFVAAQPGLLQVALDVVAHPLQGLVQGDVLFLGPMRAAVGGQVDGAEPGQGSAGQAGRGADPGQGTGGRGLGWRGWWRMAWRSVGRCGRGATGERREQRVECRLAVVAAADHFHFVLFGDSQAHDPDQAVDAGHLAGEMQFGLAGKTLRGLAQQRRRPRMQAAVVGDPRKAPGLGRFARGGGCRGGTRFALSGLNCSNGAPTSTGLVVSGRTWKPSPLLRIITVIRLRLPRATRSRSKRSRGWPSITRAPSSTSGWKPSPCSCTVSRPTCSSRLGAVVGAQAEGVAGPREVADHPGARRVQAIVQWVDGDAFAQRAAGKHRIGDSAERHHGSAQGRFEGQVLVVHGRALGFSGFG